MSKGFCFSAGDGRNGLARAILLFVTAMTASTAPVAKAETAAGTRITNVASASFLLDGQPATLSSNTVTTCVAERLGVLLQAKSARPGTAVGFSLQNTGNGPESFALTIAFGDQAVELPIRIDADGDGVFDPAVDTVSVTGGVTPQIPLGDTLDLLVIPDAAAAMDFDILTIVAAASTGTGTPGSSFDGLGEAGCDAVVGKNATASIVVPLDGAAAPATFVKSQEVKAPDGSAMPRSGATITYRLEVTTTASGTLKGAFVTDPTPAGTEYLPGSMRLDDLALSDVGDDDAGAFDGTQVRIALGDLPRATRRVATFQVKIK